MYSTKILGNQTGPLQINHSTHKAVLKDAVKKRKPVPQAAKKR